MGYFTGRDGALYLTTVLTADPTPAETDRVLKLRDWTLDTSLELLDTTTLDTAVKSFTPGAVTSTGSATVLYYRAEVSDTGKQFDQLLGKLMKTSATGVTSSDRVGMILRAGSTPGTSPDIKDDIAFNAYITNASINVATGELTSVSIQFTVDGPFLETVDA